MFKKCFVILLSSIVLIWAIPFTQAMTFTDIEGNPHSDAIIEMARLGILAGVGNDLYAPFGELNRAAAAKVAGYLLGFTESDAQKASQSKSVFTDVEGTGHAWAKGWINLMAQENIIQGIGNDLYAPGNGLQMVHWVAILSRILEHERSQMAWPKDYDLLAEELGLNRSLNYVSNRIMSRAEMARMTSTALYLVEKPDGMRIVDSVIFENEPLEDWHVNEHFEPDVYPNANIRVEVTPSIVPTGGGQKITITVTATFGDNNRPASNTTIGLFASTNENERLSQLSFTEQLTDSEGLATFTYTTLAADDDEIIHFFANINTDNDWKDRSAYAMASRTAAMVTGQITNPFNGQPAESVKLGFIKSNDPSSYQPIHVDDQSFFSAPILPGRYNINIEMNAFDTTPHQGAFRGSHFTISEGGDIRISIQNLTFESGRTYNLPQALGIVTGTHNRPLGSDIYIVRRTDQWTQIATIGPNSRFMITLPPGRYDVYNNVGTVLKGNFLIEAGKVNDLGNF